MCLRLCSTLCVNVCTYVCMTSFMYVRTCQCLHESLCNISHSSVLKILSDHFHSLSEYHATDLWFTTTGSKRLAIAIDKYFRRFVEQFVHAGLMVVRSVHSCRPVYISVTVIF